MTSKGRKEDSSWEEGKPSNWKPKPACLSLFITCGCENVSWHPFIAVCFLESVRKKSWIWIHSHLSCSADKKSSVRPSVLVLQSEANPVVLNVRECGIENSRVLMCESILTQSHTETHVSSNRWCFFMTLFQSHLSRWASTDTHKSWALLYCQPLLSSSSLPLLPPLSDCHLTSCDTVTVMCVHLSDAWLHSLLERYWNAPAWKGWWWDCIS